MIKRNQARNVISTAALALLFVVGPAVAEDRWVTDEFEIMMRTGKSNKQRILRQLPTGTRVEVLETDEESGFSRVRVGADQEGWVITRYLKRQPTAALVLPQVRQKLEKSQDTQAELRKQLAELRNDKQQLQREVNQLQSGNRSLQEQVDRITKLSSSTIQVDDENQQLKQQLAESRLLIESLEDDNTRLASRSDREWFLIGAAVMALGLLFGLIIPRLNFRKKSSWSDF